MLSLIVVKYAGPEFDIPNGKDNQTDFLFCFVPVCGVDLLNILYAERTFYINVP